jgi:UDP-N-acetylmuramate dehydrogenase
MKRLTPEQISQLTAQLPGVLLDEPMSKHTNFRIGGAARLYLVANDADALIRAVQAADVLKVPWYVFGGGSNLLVSDDGFEGLVIQSALRQLDVDGDRIRVGSGVITALVARKAADAGLAGFEWAIGVPGTIGGALYGNAGCYGGEMKDVVETVDAYRVATPPEAPGAKGGDGKRVTYSGSECSFAYRESRFKKERHILFGCTLRLSAGDTAASKKRMQEIVETRKEKQPLEFSSAGCAFKNVAVSPAQIVDLQSHTQVPDAMIQSGIISAGWAVERSGASDFSVGGVAVSSKHGNFIINTGGGTAQDVIILLSRVKTTVRDTLGLMLENEVQLLGFE